MEFPLGVEAHCSDGRCGRSTHVILNPATERVTHLVVRERRPSRVERLVPVGMVAETSPNQIHLTCSQQELHRLESFAETEFLPGEFPYAAYGVDEFRLWPYVLPGDELVPVEHEHVPPGELAVWRGSHVRGVTRGLGPGQRRASGFACGFGLSQP